MGHYFLDIQYFSTASVQKNVRLLLTLTFASTSGYRIQREPDPFITVNVRAGSRDKNSAEDPEPVCVLRVQEFLSSI